MKWKLLLKHWEEIIHQGRWGTSRTLSSHRDKICHNSKINMAKIQKTKQWPTDWQHSANILIPQEGRCQEYNKFQIIALTSYANKYLFVVLQQRHLRYMEQELPDVQAGFQKGKGIWDNIMNTFWLLGIMQIATQPLDIPWVLWNFSPRTFGNSCYREFTISIQITYYR